MSWQLLILLSVLTYSVSVLLQRVLVREDKTDPVAFAITFQVIVGIIVGIFSYLTQDMSIPSLRPIWGNFVLMLALYSAGNIFLFTALQKIEASKFTIFFSSRALVTVFASSVFLGEKLNIGQWVGAACIFAGIYLVTGKISRVNFSKFELFAFCAAVAFGLANTNDRILLKSFHVYPYVFLGFLLPSILMTIAYPSSVKHMNNFFGKKIFWKLLVLCSIYATGALLFFVALQKAPNSSQVATINLTSVIVIVLLSIIFLKEHTDWLKKIIGAVLSFIGLLLLT